MIKTSFKMHEADEMAPWLRVLAALAEDQSSVLSSYTREVTTAQDFSFGHSYPLLGVHRYLHSHLHTHMQIHTHKRKKKNTVWFLSLYFQKRKVILPNWTQSTRNTIAVLKDSTSQGAAPVQEMKSSVVTSPLGAVGPELSPVCPSQMCLCGYWPMFRQVPGPHSLLTGI